MEIQVELNYLIVRREKVNRLMKTKTKSKLWEEGKWLKIFVNTP